MPSDRPRRTPASLRGSDRAGAPPPPDAEPGRPAPAGAEAPAAGRDPFLGRTIGGCTLLARLATDELTLTFVADQPTMGRRVLLQMLTDPAAAHDPTLLNFYRSARFAARVHHPNLLAVYDVSSADNAHYCAMEYVGGRSVGDLLRAREKLPFDDAVRVALDVAEALRTANAAGVPSLVLSFDDILLTDQGTVKLRPPTFTDADAPVLGDDYVLTAIGVLLYALLSGGRVPGVEAALQPGSPAAAALPSLKSVAPGTRQDVVQVVGRLLGAGPAARFTRLESGLDALRGLLQAREKADAQLRSTTDRAVRRRKQSSALLLAGIVGGALLLLAIVGVLLHGGAGTRRLRDRFMEAHAAAGALLKQAEDAQKQFAAAPTTQGAEAVVARYREAAAHYKRFVAEFPGSDEAIEATAHARKVEEFIPVFWADAQRRLRNAAIAGEARAVDARLKAEIERMKKTGGTLDLARWRVEYTRIADRYRGAADVTQTVQSWLDALPRTLQRGQMEIDAEQVIRDCDTQHAPRNNFRAGIAAWDAFRDKYGQVPFLREEAATRHEAELNKLRRGAALAYHQLDGEAKRLADRKDYKGARALYEKAVQNFGFDSLVEKAKQELAKLPKE
jgi:hypothetical protein